MQKNQPGEFLVSGMQTINALTNPGIKEEFSVNQKITFYVTISKVNKPKVVYTLREYFPNSSSIVITSGSIDERYTGHDLSLDYTPTQNKDLITLEFTATCGKEVIKRFKYLMAK
ncbi:hypothetical protein [uncultured Mucilaginibacter sp.]|uniref:hypothetical protein n=1 Tax=uncultured Mucilaginibacter sp. TaxID=797541 RepID=UPI00260C5D90|nr:hypothetical protein [uncultured Mucilaginibacter sp.]